MAAVMEQHAVQLEGAQHEALKGIAGESALTAKRLVS
jgi:hypothetical protein